MRPQRRRRSRPSLVARARAYWLVGIVLLAAAAWGGWTLATLPAFRLSALHVSGLGRVSRADVVQRAALDPRANIWFLDRHAVERRIEASPYVAKAFVHRRLPGAVWIEVRERRPEACVRDAVARTFTLDAESRVLERGCVNPRFPQYDLAGRLGAAPGAYVRDPELAVLQKDARALGSDGARYRRFGHDAFGELDATLQSGIRVRFGDDDDLARKQNLVRPILAQLGARAGDVRVVDVRAPQTPVVEYRVPTPAPRPPFPLVHRRAQAIDNQSTLYRQGTRPGDHNM